MARRPMCQNREKSLVRDAVSSERCSCLISLFSLFCRVFAGKRLRLRLLNRAQLTQ